MRISGSRSAHARERVRRTLAWVAAIVPLLVPGPASRLAAQEPIQEAAPPVVDTIIVVRNQVFTDEQAESSGVFRLMNSIHVTTKEWLIRDYLQFEAGQPFDSALVAESERRLRAKNLFREMSIDSVRLEDGRLAVRVETRDGWSLKPKYALSVASTGEWTGTLGINDINLLGTGNQVYVAYVKEIDRDGLNLTLDFDRMFSSEIDLLFNHAGLSDGKNSNWVLGAPFRNNESTRSLEWDGSSADQYVFRYRNEVEPDGATLDTTIYRRDALVNNLTAGLATRHSPRDYLRFAVTGGVRSESFRLPDSVGVATEDSIYGTVGGWAEFSSADFLQLARFNGFGTEDLDLSRTVRLTATLAPDAFGWRGTGIGLGIGAAAGTKAFAGRGWAWSSIDANYQWGGVAQDSGRVVFNVAAGYKPAERHSTAIQVQLGRLWNQKPGDEFDLGFASAPRGWPAHAFVGDQMWWASLEHRLYAVDEFLGLFGLGFGAFIDYGGAWYDDQEARSGGSVGIGLRLGSALSTVARTGRMDFAFNFGSGRDAAGVDGFTFVLGAGFAFPRRPIPVISYRAVQPQ
ncbi:MAG: hypothetical protein P8125_12305 [Gemmatimonadota bacterium]